MAGLPKVRDNKGGEIRERAEAQVMRSPVGFGKNSRFCSE